MSQNLESTAGFIKRRCKKDHLKTDAAMGLQTNKMSLYKNQYSGRSSQAMKDFTNLIGKEVNSCNERKSRQFVGSLGSNYKENFDRFNSIGVQRMKEKPSFFLKNEDYEKLQSTYNRMSRIEKKIDYSFYEKGKGQSDNLSVPKYNRMSSSSVYKIEYEQSRLPSIYSKKKNNSIHRQISKYSE